MNNLNKILLSSLIALSFSAQAKDEPKATEEVQATASATPTNNAESLETALATYKQIQVDAELEKSIAFIYPPIFEKIPKEAMLESFKMAKANGPKPASTKLEQKPVLPVKEYSKGVYTTVAYTMETSMDITPPKSDAAKTAQMEEMLKNPEELKKFKEFMLGMLKASMGSESEVAFQKDSFVVDVKKAGTYLAINEEKAGWKFIDMAPMLIQQIKSVLPKDIIEGEKALFDKVDADAVNPMKAMMDAMPK